MSCKFRNRLLLGLGSLICFLLAHAATRQAPEQCITDAANYHGVHPGVLRAILRVESGFKADAVGRNDNGTIDVGLGQVNSIHFRELSQYGITPANLLDACISTYVSAWLLRRQIDRYGNTWQGIATYHSTTPSHNTRYANLIYQELVREGWIARDPAYHGYQAQASSNSNSASHVTHHHAKTLVKAHQPTPTPVARAHSPLVLDIGSN